MLDAWCNTHANCPHRNLVARFAGGLDFFGRTWGCYAPSTLSLDGMRYSRGTQYCTRHEELSMLMRACSSPHPYSQGCDDEVCGPVGLEVRPSRRFIRATDACGPRGGTRSSTPTVPPTAACRTPTARCWRASS